MTHIERMELELKELKEKIEKAAKFLEKETLMPAFTDNAQRHKLEHQIWHMTEYSKVLKERIEYDKAKNK